MSEDLLRCFRSKEGEYFKKLCFNDEDFQNVWQGIKDTIRLNRDLRKRFEEGEKVRVEVKFKTPSGKIFTLVLDAKKGEEIVYVDLVEEG